MSKPDGCGRRPDKGPPHECSGVARPAGEASGRLGAAALPELNSGRLKRAPARRRSGDALPELFQAALAQLCPQWLQARFLVALSGGLDSTALFLLTIASLPPQQVAAAHLHHGLRGAAADADQLLAQSLAQEAGCAFFSARRPVAALARQRGKGLEEAARRARYEFLDEAAASWGADFILTAHQADDQAETVLLNLLKGAGPAGLAGIPPRRRAGGGVEILRPLLGFSRLQLRRWLESWGRVWAKDLSNGDPRHLRNFLRHSVIPLLKNHNPRLAEALGRSADILRREEEFWREHTARLWAQAEAGAQACSGCLRLRRSVLASLSLAELRRLIYEALRQLWRTRPLSPEPLSFAAVDTVTQLLSLPRHRGLDLPGGLRAELTPELLTLSLASRFRGGAEL